MLEPEPSYIVHWFYHAQLEYSSQLWLPFQINHKLLLENAQRRATKFILDYPQDLNYKQRLVKLNLLPSSYRQDMLDVVFFFKCQHGHYNLDISHFVEKRPKSNYSIRSYDPYNFTEFKSNRKYEFLKIVCKGCTELGTPFPWILNRQREFRPLKGKLRTIS